MGNCQALLTFPEEVMKILHVVFSAISVILIVLWGPYTDVYGTAKKAEVAKYAVVTTQGLMIILMCLVLVCGVALLVWFIFDDPRKFKTPLLVYYVVAFGLCLAAFFLGVLTMDKGCQARRELGCFGEDELEKKAAEHYGYQTAPEILGYVLGTMIFTVLTAVTYAFSAVLNGMGKP